MKKNKIKSIYRKKTVIKTKLLSDVDFSYIIWFDNNTIKQMAFLSEMNEKQLKPIIEELQKQNPKDFGNFPNTCVLEFLYNNKDNKITINRLNDNFEGHYEK